MNRHTKLRLWPTGTLLIAFIVQPLIASAQVSSDQSPGSDQSIQQAIKETSGTEGFLSRLGLKKGKVTHLEAYADCNTTSGQECVFSTDGPTVTLHAEISNDLIPVSLQQLGTFSIEGTFMTNELVSIEDSKLKSSIINGDINWGHFFREAKVIFDIDPKSGAPIATVIKSATVGIQDIESNAFNSQMPIPDNGALRGITRQRSAQAVRIDMNSKLFDSVSMAIFRTGVYHPENFRDNPQERSLGATVFMTKSFADHLHVSGAVTKVDFPEKAEVRINSGVAYESKEGGYSVFYNRVDFRNNPLYPDATMAQTAGVVKQLGSRHKITVEETRVNNGYREHAVGYTYSINARTSVGVGLRRTSDGETKVEGRAAYSFDK